MWIEAIVTHADLVQVLRDLLPLKIYLDTEDNEVDKDRWFLIKEALHVELVRDQGLRVTCAAEFRWTIAGVGPTIKLDSVGVFLKPRVVEKHKGGALEFQIEVEETDFHSLPDLIDHTIAKTLNAALSTKKIPWNFSDTLSRTVPLPKMLEQVEALKIDAPWGEIRIREEALVLVISVKLGFVRND